MSGRNTRAATATWGLGNVADLALKAGAKELWLTHYYDFDAPEVVLAEVREAGFFGASKLAQDGDR